MLRISVHTHTKCIVSLIFRYLVVNRIAVALTLFAYCNFHNNTTWQNGCILVILEIRRPKFIFARKKYQIMLNENSTRPLILHENCSHFLFPAFPLVHCRSLWYYSPCKFTKPIYTDNKFILFPQIEDPCSWYDFQFGHCRHVQKNLFRPIFDISNHHSVFSPMPIRADSTKSHFYRNAIRYFAM